MSALSASLAWSAKLEAQEEAVAAASVSASANLMTPEEAGTDSGYLQRYAPQANTLEVGVFTGLLFVSDRNSFRGPGTVVDGVPIPRPYSTYKPAPEFGARVAYFPLAFLGAEAEGIIAPADTDSRAGAVLASGRGHLIVQSPLWSITPFALAGGGYWAAFNDVSGDDGDPGFHFGGGVKASPSNLLAFRIDVRDVITNARQNGSMPHNLEVTAGASFVLGRAKPAPADTDADGILDTVDRCPHEAGPAPEGCPFHDRDQDTVADAQDQCPDEPGPAPRGCPPTDTDADGVFDTEDLCLNEPGIRPSGCPDRDSDGILDKDDQCPAVAGLAPDGCPGDSDGDGFTDAQDKCPLEAEVKNGFEDDDGCPDEIPEAVKTFTGVIAGIEFDVNQASIRPSSFAVLDQAARILTEYPTLRVEIIGHTDDTGAREHNLALSLERASSVKSYLVSRGVDESRISPRGAGPDEPLIAAKTRQARQKNRRIEFKILQ